MATITVGDLTIAYEIDGSGPAMVLLHGGLATSAIMWGKRPLELARRYTVVTPDSRGHGRTNNPAGRLSYAQMADDFAGLIAALGLERPIVVGYSDGAQIGLELGLRHPGIARALVLGGLVTGMSAEYLQALAGMGFTVPGEVDIERMKAEFGDYFDIMVTQPHGDGPDYWRGFIKQISTLWLTVPDYGDAQLASLADPVLVMCGDRDSAALSDALRLHRLRPRGELCVVPGSGHGAAEKDLFWLAVDDFVARLDRI